MEAVVRPGSWNLVLYVHVAGAMALVATLVVAAFAIVNAARRGDRAAIGFAGRTLLLAVLPAYLVMRVGAQLIVSKEHLENSDASWLGIGFAAADGGALLLLIALILTGVAVRRTAGGAVIRGSALLRTALALAGLMILLDLVAIYAMTTKPA